MSTGGRSSTLCVEMVMFNHWGFVILHLPGKKPQEILK